MRKTIINCPAFESQNSDENNVCRLRTGKHRYHQVMIDIAEDGTAMPKADIITKVEEIVVKINEGQIWRIKPAHYFAVETTNDRDFTVEDGEIILHFSNRNIEGILQQEATGVGTAGVANFTVEVVLGTVVNPTLSAKAEVDDVVEAPGLVRHLRYKTWAVTEIGEYQKAIEGRAASYKALHLFETQAGDIENIRMEYEGKYVYDQSPRIIHALARPYGYTVESKQIHLPFDRRIIGEALPSQVEMADGRLRDAGINFNIEMGAANSLVLVEDFYASPKVY